MGNKISNKLKNNQPVEDVKATPEEQIWGQDNNVDALPNKIEIEYNLFYNQDDKKKPLDIRDTSYNPATANKVNFSNNGMYFATNDRHVIQTLQDHYANQYGLMERRPFDEIDPITQLPTNFIKEGMLIGVVDDKLGKIKAKPVQTSFDPLDTYNEIPLKHPAQMKEPLLI